MTVAEVRHKKATGIVVLNFVVSSLILKAEFEGVFVFNPENVVLSIVVVVVLEVSRVYSAPTTWRVDPVKAASKNASLASPGGNP